MYYPLWIRLFSGGLGFFPQRCSAWPQLGAIWHQRQNGCPPYHWKRWYGCAETRAKTTETCGVPGLPFVFVAKIAGLRGGWALQCARSCCPSYWRYPSIGCQAQILIYISMLYMLFGLGFYVMVNHSFNEISGYISWMGSKSSRIEWQARWNMRFPLKHAVWCFGKHLYCHPILPHWNMWVMLQSISLRGADVISSDFPMSR